MFNSNYTNNVNIRDKGVIRGPALTADNSHTTCLYKPLIGQLDRKATAGQTQQLLVVLLATDVMWHILGIKNMNG